MDSNQGYAVLLVNLGGPDSLKAVRPFLRNLFSDRYIIKLPLQPLLARIIAFFRARKVRKRYKLIGGKSPLLDLTKEQALALESKLQAEGLKIKVFIAMRYWQPFIAETVNSIVKEGFTDILVLPLFPQYSKATTGSCLAEIEKVLKKYKGKVNVYPIKDWPEQERYIQSLVKKIKNALDRFPPDKREEVEVIFTAHSLPQEFVDQGDPYVTQVQQTINACLQRLPLKNWHLAFQSRSGPVKWLEPATDKLITQLAERGARYLLFVPISFVSDHIETVYEIDIMFKEQAVKEGFVQIERSSSLNTDSLFIEALADLVRDKVKQITIKEEVLP